MAYRDHLEAKLAAVEQTVDGLESELRTVRDHIRELRAALGCPEPPPRAGAHDELERRVAQLRHRVARLEAEADVRSGSTASSPGDDDVRALVDAEMGPLFNKR